MHWWVAPTCNGTYLDLEGERTVSSRGLSPSRRPSRERRTFHIRILRKVSLGKEMISLDGGQTWRLRGAILLERDRLKKRKTAMRNFGHPGFDDLSRSMDHLEGDEEKKFWLPSNPISHVSGRWGPFTGREDHQVLEKIKSFERKDNMDSKKTNQEETTNNTPTDEQTATSEQSELQSTITDVVRTELTNIATLHVGSTDTWTQEFRDGFEAEVLHCSEYIYNEALRLQKAAA